MSIDRNHEIVGRRNRDLADLDIGAAYPVLADDFDTIVGVWDSYSAPITDEYYYDARMQALIPQRAARRREAVEERAEKTPEAGDDQRGPDGLRNAYENGEKRRAFGFVDDQEGHAPTGRGPSPKARSRATSRGDLDGVIMRIVSLFSGAGGLDLGLIHAGHEIVWANDIDPDAIETYRKNIGDHAVLGDISAVSSADIPDCDVVVGGFPCQGFSQANMLRFEDDDRNRLYLEFRRVVKDKKPKFFLAENVRGILSLAGGKAIETIERDFAAAGYRVATRLFNVADYGVPQNRRRVIIAGTRRDLPRSMDYQFPEPTHADPRKAKALGLAPWRTISEGLAGIPEPDAKHRLPNHICSQYKVTNRNFTGHRETDPDKPSPTILARGNGKGGVCAIQHPKNHRRMSIREQAALQAFPLDFEFVGRMNSCYRQVGNAVPVLFGRVLGEQLVEAAKLREVA